GFVMTNDFVAKSLKFAANGLKPPVKLKKFAAKFQRELYIFFKLSGEIL
ncbi:hypothetical protein SAMN05660413_02163, partial [Salegentibacter flavus]